MKNLTYVMLAGSFLGLVYGLYAYFEEEAFLKQSTTTIAKVEYVKDDPVVVATEGGLSGPRKYADHVCHYAIAFNLSDNQSAVKAQLTSVGKSCLGVGSSIPIRYDRKSPSDTVRNQNDEPMFHRGVLPAILGFALMLTGYLDLRKSKKGANVKSVAL